MILELGDGRELHLPDEMDDEAARRMKLLILGNEQSAREARAELAAMRVEMAAMRNEVAAAMNIAKAFDALRETLEQGVKRIVKAQLADRVVVPDASGEYTRSKADMKEAG